MGSNQVCILTADVGRGFLGASQTLAGPSGCLSLQVLGGFHLAYLELCAILKAQTREVSNNPEPCSSTHFVLTYCLAAEGMRL